MPSTGGRATDFADQGLSLTPWHFLKLAERARHLAKLVARSRGSCGRPRGARPGDLAACVRHWPWRPETPSIAVRLPRRVPSLAETLILLKKHDEATKLTAEFACFPGIQRENLCAGSLMARCVPLAAADLELPEGRRGELAEDYAKRAIALLREP